ncbi:helix-turn-helix transcriptional regulator [uncultured Brevundimonas sp.]|uniref:helix-turn-helix domain-containing protein n=1 Tax=uncultured Brevundimonas sp. TaxID=213418 RepID=UPI0030EBFEFD|tara:strand:- start:170560 stop:171156 length:597 start_codon:yes stop_codon:yes gene_type:complete
MSRFQYDPAARRLGESLAALRHERDLSQAEAGARVGMTGQGWGLYEAGRRPGLFRPDVQRRLTGALDFTPDALMPGPVSAYAAEAAPVVAGVEERGRAFDAGEAASKPEVRRLQLSNDDLSPWAASGVVLEYQSGRWPRRDQGCVIQMQDGSVRVRLYEWADDGVVSVRGGPGGLAVTVQIPRSDISMVSAVMARLEF